MATNIPVHKLIPNTGFTVDGFRCAHPSVKAYFLSHAHSDHYQGLSESWQAGPIYCSAITGKLVSHLCSVRPEYLHALPMNEPVTVEGVEVTLVDANHCPGAVQFLFQLPGGGGRYVHCGDMRFSKAQMENSHLQRFVGARAVFLDTTYCHPRHVFPPQEASVKHVVDTIEALLAAAKAESGEPTRVFVISTYVIGKERILLAVHRRCGVKICVSEKKLAVIKCLDLPDVEVDEVFTVDPKETPVHVASWGFLGDTWPYFRPNFVNMDAYREEQGVDEVVGFVPTGWMAEMKKAAFPVRRKGRCAVHLVPYSEHSSYEELRDYVRFLKPHQVVPTVGVGGEGAEAEKKVAALLKHFSNLVDEQASKARFLSAFTKGVSSVLDNGSSACDEAAGGALPAPQSASSIPVRGMRPDGGPSVADLEVTELSDDSEGAARVGAAESHQGLRLRLRKAAELCGPLEAGSEGQPEDMKDACEDHAVEGVEETLRSRKRRHAEASTSVRATRAQSAAAAAGLGRLNTFSPPGEAGENGTPAGRGSNEGYCAPIDAACADNGGQRTSRAQQNPETPANGTATLNYDNSIPGENRTACGEMPPEAAAGAAESDMQQPGAKTRGFSWGPSTDAGTQETANLRLPLSQQSSRDGQKGSKRACGVAEDVAGCSAAAAGALLVEARSASHAAPVLDSGGDPPLERLLRESGSNGSAESQELEDPTPSAALGAQTAAADEAAGAVLCSQIQMSGEIQQILAVIGGEIDAARAAELLQQCQGSPRAAVNAYFDSLTAGPKQLVSAGKAQSLAAGKPSLSQKRKPEAGRSPAAKRPKQNRDAAQRSIKAFFTASPGSKSVQPPSCGMLAQQPEQEQEASLDPRLLAGVAPQPVVLLSDEEEITVEQPLFKPAVLLNSGLPSVGLSRPPRDSNHAENRRNAATDGDTAVAPATMCPSNTLRSVSVGMTQAPAIQPPINAPFSAPVSAGLPSLPLEQAAGPARPTPPVDAVLFPFAEYKPVEYACWQTGEPTPYLHLARAFQAMESTKKRLSIGAVITNMFRSVLALSPDDMLATCYLTCGKIAPEFEQLELSVGESTVAAAVAEATGCTRAHLREMYKQLGDLGDVAQACRTKQRMLVQPAPLTVAGVFGTLHAIALEKGAGAAGRRQRAIGSLISRCREGVETRYLVRTLVQNLRVNANWRSVIGALARAIVLHRDGVGASKGALDAAAAAALDCFHMCPSLDLLLPALLEGGIPEMERRCTLTPGVPLKPMLAKICEGIPDALSQLRDTGATFLAEYKYDGQRAQIHMLPDGLVKLFSRNCEERTQAFPDVAHAVRAAALGGCSSFVLDAELVAVDRGDGNRLRAFQELATRARGAVTVDQVLVDVCVFAFDLLFVDGEPLLHLPLRQRRNRLAQALPNLKPGFVQMAESCEIAADGAYMAANGDGSSQPAGDSSATAEALVASQGLAPIPSEAAETSKVQQAADAGETTVAARMAGAITADAAEEAPQAAEEKVQEFLLEAFAGGTEGLMLKRLDVGAAYQPSKRSESWIKIKRDYCEGLRDSLDLVPIGAWHGNGRKAGWMSPFLLAAYDPDSETYQSVCRCISGFSDAFYAEATARLGALQLPEKPRDYQTGERPSMWFPATEVWEIRGADLTISPVHKAAAGHLHLDRGVSLRFPRFIRLRPDKTPEEASGPELLVELFNKQTRRVQGAAERLGRGLAQPLS